MKYFSMFSGIGGFENGIHRAFDVQEKRGGEEATQRVNEKGEGLHTLSEQRTSTTTNTNDEHANRSANKGQPHCVGYSEIDKYAIKVYERQFNGHTNYGDATKINPKELPDFDLLVGGFPCQAFSVAGKRKGFNDTRGTLFFDIARILAEKRPRHLVLENVKGLLSHDSGKTLQTIFGVLSDLGYRIEWQVLNSKDFGVPQNRERIYIVGHLGGECSGKVFPITGAAGKDINQLNPGVRETKRIYGDDGASPTLNTAQGGQRVPKLAIDMTRRAEESYRERKDNISGTVTATYYKGIGNAERPGVKEGTRIRRLTPLECERLQGFPDDWTKDGIVVDSNSKNSINYHFERISDTQRYKMCGNAVTVNVVEAVMERLFNHG